jgi:hypothetical protein
VFAGRGETQYEFEKPDWWVKQVDELARFYIQAEFGDDEID